MPAAAVESPSMAKLYFYYSAMNAGKTTNLLQSAHNYRERGMRTLILTPRLDDRGGRGGVVASRIGLRADGTAFDRDTDLERLVVLRADASDCFGHLRKMLAALIGPLQILRYAVEADDLAVVTAQRQLVRHAPAALAGRIEMQLELIPNG